jgi:hypothetical protein
MYSDQLRYCGIRRVANITLVMKFIPEFFPCGCRIAMLKSAKCAARIIRDSIAALEASPSIIIEIHSVERHAFRVTALNIAFQGQRTEPILTSAIEQLPG